jgi:hypothetical protein
MSSENPSGADNQQETRDRALDPRWVSGFVDGEGCFSISFHKNPHVRSTRGWQVTAVFQVSQHERDREILERLAFTFGCGGVRSKGPRSTVDVYGVSSRQDLVDRILPFFEAWPLEVKRRDFELFATIVRSMRSREHLEPTGFERIVHLAYEMNGTGKQRARSKEAILLGSSETVRQAPHGAAMIQSDPHGDMRSRTEMIRPPSGTYGPNEGSNKRA